jgi:hypothetical protein
MCGSENTAKLVSGYVGKEAVAFSTLKLNVEHAATRSVAVVVRRKIRRDLKKCIDLKAFIGFDPLLLV